MFVDENMLDELHYYERPIALQTQLMVAINRDTKKQKKAQPLEDFFFYKRQELSDLPAAVYGAAAKKLIEMKLFPSWALFCYKDIMMHAGSIAPSPVALLHEDAIILAPRPGAGSVEGLLIAKESVSQLVIEMKDTDGQVVKIQMPRIENKLVALENEELAVL